MDWLMKKRLTAMLLVLLMLASCNAVPAETESESQITPDVQETETAPLTEADIRAQAKDSLPEISFEGAAYRALTKEYCRDEFAVDELTGESINDAIYERNNVVEERFNVKIETIISPDGSMYGQVNDIKNRVIAQDDSFDIAGTYVMTAGAAITSGYLLDWNDMPYNDFSQPWWLSDINKNFSVNNRLYTVAGEMCSTLLELTYCVFFNRTQGDRYGLTDTVIQTVQDGKWTIDYLNELISNIYEDTNGDGERDMDDFYGFTGEQATNLMMYTYAFDIPLTTRNADGIPEISVNSEKTVNAVEKVSQLYWNNGGSYITDNASSRALFASGNAMFHTACFSHAISVFREMEDDYTILPYVKYDEAQEKYLTSAMDNYSVLCIPVTCQKTDMVSVVTESLNVESYRSVFQVYYEKALKAKYARDEVSIEMIDLIMAGRTFDFATLFTGSESLNNLNTIFQMSVLSQNADFASRYASQQNAMQTELDNIITIFEGFYD